jgi:hypothetical protein
MLGIERASNNARPNTTSRIERSTSIINAHHLRNKQRKSNTHRRNKRSLMFLLRQHKNRKHQLRRQNRLNKHTLHQTRAAGQRRPYIQRCRKQAQNHCTGSDSADDLREEEADGPHDGDGADEHHAEGHGRVEEPAGDAEEDPDVDHEGEAEDDGDVEVHGDVEAGGAAGGGGGGGGGLDVGYLGAGEGEEEEHGCADEFAHCCDEVYSVLGVVMVGWGKDLRFLKSEFIHCVHGSLMTSFLSSGERFLKSIAVALDVLCPFLC